MGRGAILVAMWWTRGSAKTMTQSGAPAPSFSLTGLDGRKRSLEELTSQGPVVLAFFKISCPVCQLTMPFLERLSSSSTLQIVGISQDDESATQHFNQRLGVTFPVLLDRSKEGYPASNAYGISSVPSLFVVEPDGRVSMSFNGFSKRDLETVGERAGVRPFQASDNVPEWKAG